MARQDSSKVNEISHLSPRNGANLYSVRIKAPLTPIGDNDLQSVPDIDFNINSVAQQALDNVKNSTNNPRLFGLFSSRTIHAGPTTFDPNHVGHPNDVLSRKREPSVESDASGAQAVAAAVAQQQQLNQQQQPQQQQPQQQSTPVTATSTPATSANNNNNISNLAPPTSAPQAPSSSSGSSVVVAETVNNEFENILKSKVPTPLPLPPAHGVRKEDVVGPKIEGREIKQDHELYALTYGMMLGIRVMLRRMQIWERNDQPGTLASPLFSPKTADAMGLHSNNNSNPNPTAIPVQDSAAVTSSSAPVNHDIEPSTSLSSSPRESEERIIELTHEDYLQVYELEFPPEGSVAAAAAAAAEAALKQSPRMSLAFPSMANFSRLSLLAAPPSPAHPQPAHSPSNLMNTTVSLQVMTPPHKLPKTFRFKDYMSKAFRVVRGLAGLDEVQYMRSVAGDFNYIEFIANSKSGQFFFYSHDGKYMIKTQTKEESKFLRKIMPQYVEHIFNHPNSLLVRYYGMHRVKMDFLSTSRTIYFIIMSSVFDTDKIIHIKYDLKGSTIGRITKDADCKMGAVQKDLNLVKSGRKFRLPEAHMEIFKFTIESDSNFLASLNIMDYSLLVGVHESATLRPLRRPSGSMISEKSLQVIQSMAHSAATQASVPRVVPKSSPDDSIFQSFHGGIRSAPEVGEIYFLGIIDILQVYNVGKRGETVFKSLLGNGNKISSVHPKYYASRFVDFLLRNTNYSELREQMAHLNEPKLSNAARVSADNSEVSQASASSNGRPNSNRIKSMSGSKRKQSEEGNLQLVVNLQKESSSKDTAASSLGASLLDSEGSFQSSVGPGLEQRRSSSLEATQKPQMYSESSANSNANVNLPTVKEIDDDEGEVKTDLRMSSKSRPSSGRQNPLVRRSPERKASERLSNSPKKTGTMLSIDTETKVEPVAIHTDPVVNASGEPILNTAQIYGKPTTGELSTPIPAGKGISVDPASATAATAGKKSVSSKRRPAEPVCSIMLLYIFLYEFR